MTAFTGKTAKNQGVVTLENDSTGLRSDSTGKVSSICEAVTPSSPFKLSLEQHSIETLQHARDAIKSVTMGTGKVNDKARAGLHAINLDGATVLGWTGKQAMDNRISISEVIAAKKLAEKPAKVGKVSGELVKLENIVNVDVQAAMDNLAQVLAANKIDTALNIVSSSGDVRAKASVFGADFKSINAYAAFTGEEFVPTTNKEYTQATGTRTKNARMNRIELQIKAGKKLESFSPSDRKFYGDQRALN